MNPRRVPRELSVEALVDASPAAVWEVLCDVTRIGEWSSECRGARWLDGASAALPGARFRGSNRSGTARWSRTCVVTAADPPRELVWHVLPTTLYRDHTEWRVVLEPHRDGTRIHQRNRVLHMPRALELVVATSIPDHRDRTEVLRADLLRLGAVAARPQLSPI